jgi:Helix-loop-helix DNA-binding domain
MVSKLETQPLPPLVLEDNEDSEINLNLPVDYLEPMSFMSMEPVSWTQQALGDPSDPDELKQMSFGPLDDAGFDYNFTLRTSYFGLPSPPNSNTSFDAPSPSNGFTSSANSNLDLPISLDPALTNTICAADPSPTPDSITGVGIKRNHKGDGTKTSHTIIERRYRNNLNTHMIGLRQAVPALRILDKDMLAPTNVVDVVDGRGYVDGVKVAKKSSKSTILGKATEYIL